MRAWVVYRTKERRFGYRSLADELGPSYTRRAAGGLMASLITLGEAVCCWALEAPTGGQAITLLKRELKRKALDQPAHHKGGQVAE